MTDAEFGILRDVSGTFLYLRVDKEVARYTAWLQNEFHRRFRRLPVAVFVKSGRVMIAGPVTEEEAAQGEGDNND